MSTRALYGVAVILAAGLAWGDTLVLKTGARYSGTISRTAGGAVAIASAQGTREFPDDAVNWRLTTFTAPANETAVRELLQKKKYAEALPLLQRWESRYRNLPTKWYEEALFRLGECYVNLQRADEAKQQFERLLERFPRSRHRNEAETYLIDLQVAGQSGPELAARLQRLLDDPKSNARVRAKAHQGLGALRLEGNDLRGALEHYVHIIVLYGDVSELQEDAQEKVAQLYSTLGRTNEAVFYYQQLLEAYPDSAAAAARKERLAALRAATTSPSTPTDKETNDEK